MLLVMRVLSVVPLAFKVRLFGYIPRGVSEPLCSLSRGQRHYPASCLFSTRLCARFPGHCEP